MISTPDDWSLAIIEAAKRLETELVQFYSLAACAAKREESVEKTAEIWKEMVRIADDFCASLEKLKRKHPRCGVELVCDNVERIRRKCIRLQSLHS